MKSVFDKTWISTLKALETAVSTGEEIYRDLRGWYVDLPKANEVTVGEREHFIGIRKEVEAAVTELGKNVSDLLQALRGKLANPAEEQQVPEALREFNIDSWAGSFAEYQSAIASTIEAHNKVHAEFGKMQQQAFDSIETHVLASNQAEWSRLLHAVESAQTGMIAAQEDESTISERLTAIRNELEDHGVGADKMNELVWAYLGHKEIRLVAEKEGGYRIFRSGGEPARGLSEGERTAVSFCFFLTLLAAEGRKADELVLVIDDPISSLDTSARTHAYSLLTRMTKKCAQVVVLTHNTSFMNMVKREFQNKNRFPNEGACSLLSLDCKDAADGRVGRCTKIIPMHSLLLKHDSEYHYLFHVVNSAAESGETPYLFLLPNATRKLLEIFATFCSPGEPNFAAALMDHHEAVKDKLDTRALERLVQIESHGTMEGLGSPPDLTLEEAIRAAKAAMCFIKEVGREHYKRMQRAVRRETAVTG